MNLKTRREMKIFIWKSHWRRMIDLQKSVEDILCSTGKLSDLWHISASPAWSNSPPPVLHSRQQLCPGQRTGPVPLPDCLLLGWLLRADWLCPRWTDAKELLVLLPVRQRDQRAPHFADAGGLGRAAGVQDGDHLVQEERWGSCGTRFQTPFQFSGLLWISVPCVRVQVLVSAGHCTY